MKKIYYLYMITIGDYVYIGLSHDRGKQRSGEHLEDILAGKKPKEWLDAWDEFRTFSFYRILEGIPDQKEAIRLEKAYIAHWRHNNYHLYKDGKMLNRNHGGGGRGQGTKDSEEAKKRGLKSKAKKGEKNPEYKHTVHIFRHKTTGEYFIGTQHEFYTKFEYHPTNVINLIKGWKNQGYGKTSKVKSYDRWVYLGTAFE